MGRNSRGHGVRVAAVAALRNLDLQAEDKTAPGFSVAVKVQGLVDAALECLIHDEVESVQFGKLIAHDLAAQQLAECRLQPLGASAMP